MCACVRTCKWKGKSGHISKPECSQRAKMTSRHWPITARIHIQKIQLRKEEQAGTSVIGSQDSSPRGERAGNGEQGVRNKRPLESVQ